MAFPFALAGIYASPRQQRPWWILLTTLLVAGVAASYTRAGVYLVLFLAVVYALIRDRRLLIWVAVYALVFNFVFPGLLTRTGGGLEDVAAVVTDPTVSTGEPQAGGTFRQRYQLAYMGLVMFKDNPLLGVGLGDYVPTHDRLIGGYPSVDVGVRTLVPHNTYIRYAAEMGVLGLLALLLLLFIVSRVILHLFRTDVTLAPWWKSDKALGVLGVFLTMCIYAMNNDVFMDPPVAISFWALVLGQVRLLTASDGKRVQ